MCLPVQRIRVEPVAAAEFRRRLRTARSYRDVIRIFIRSEERLRDEDIDDFVASPLMTSAAETGNNGNAIASHSIIVGSSGRQSIEDNGLPSNGTTETSLKSISHILIIISWVHDK